jgi:hypothetical protein
LLRSVICIGDNVALIAADAQVYGKAGAAATAVPQQ